MLKFLLKFIINIIALFIVINLISGIKADSWESLVVAALVLGLLNAFLRPVIFVLTMPLTIATFGLFTLIINGFLFYLAAKFVTGFSVTSFWNAVWAAIIFSVISFLLNTLLTPTAKVGYFSYRHRAYQEPKYKDAIDVEWKPADQPKGE